MTLELILSRFISWVSSTISDAVDDLTLTSLRGLFASINSQPTRVSQLMTVDWINSAQPCLLFSLHRSSRLTRQCTQDNGQTAVFFHVIRFCNSSTKLTFCFKKCSYRISWTLREIVWPLTQAYYVTRACRWFLRLSVMLTIHSRLYFGVFRRNDSVRIFELLKSLYYLPFYQTCTVRSKR